MLSQYEKNVRTLQEEYDTWKTTPPNYPDDMPNDIEDSYCENFDFDSYSYQGPATCKNQITFKDDNISLKNHNGELILTCPQKTPNGV